MERTLHLPDGLTIDKNEKRRLKQYYYGTTYLAAVMCCLRNQVRSRSERTLFNHLSALAYSFDDLAESWRNQAGQHVRGWDGDPETFGAVADQRGLTPHLLQRLCAALPENRLGPFRGYMQRVFKAETEGKHIETNLDIETLQQATAEKGGCSALLFRCLLDHPLDRAEEDAIFQFGCLIQFCDDLFDLWHDRQASIATLATHLAEQGALERLSTLFEAQVTATCRAFRQTRYPVAQVETALCSVHYLVSVTRHCLWHYLGLERAYGALPLHDRTQMVVDMAVWAHRLRALGFLLRPFP